MMQIFGAQSWWCCSPTTVDNHADLIGYPSHSPLFFPIDNYHGAVLSGREKFLNGKCICFVNLSLLLILLLTVRNLLLETVGR